MWLGSLWSADHSLPPCFASTAALALIAAQTRILRWNFFNYQQLLRIATQPTTSTSSTLIYIAFLRQYIP